MTYDRFLIRSHRLISRLPAGITALSAAILIGSLALSRSSYATYVSTTIDQFLGTLVLAQASVLAIVFSVVILAVQLTASRYSNQITDMYVRNPVFLVTFGLFLISIGFDLALLYTHPTLLQPVTASMVYVAAGLTVVVAIWLIYFIRFTFMQLTPEGIVSMFEDEITPERTRRLLHSSQADNPEGTEMDHPLLSLYSLTVQAIKNEERFMASRALRELGTQMVTFLEETTVDGSPDAETLELMYEPVLTVYLPEIIELGQEREMEEIAEQGLDWMYRIGRAGNETAVDQVVKIASDGFEGIIDRDAADPTKRQTFATSWEKWGMLVKEICAEAELDTIQHVFSGFEQQVNLIGNREFDHRVRQRILVRFCSDVQQCHETLLERYGPSVEDLDVSWEDRFLPTESDPDKVAAQLLVKCRNLFVLFSSIVLTQLVETDEYPIRFNSFRGLWADICSGAVRHAPYDYARTICEIYIEVAFVSILYEKNVETTTDVQRRIEVWASPLGRIARIRDQAPVAGAFDAVLDQHTTRYLSVSSYTPITQTDAYPELVERIRAETE